MTAKKPTDDPEPWKLLGKDVAFETPWFKITRQHMRTADGVEAEYFVHDTYDSVICVCITPDNKVILEKQYRPPVEKVSYDYPAGGMSKDDATPEAGMRRELHEELGFKAHILKRVATLDANPGFSKAKVHIFVAHGAIEEPAKPEATEHIVNLFVKPPDDILKMIDEGVISCVFCVSATMIVFRYLGFIDGLPQGKR